MAASSRAHETASPVGICVAIRRGHGGMFVHTDHHAWGARSKGRSDFGSSPASRAGRGHVPEAPSLAEAVPDGTENLERERA